MSIFMIVVGVFLLSILGALAGIGVYMMFESAGVEVDEEVYEK